MAQTIKAWLIARVVLVSGAIWSACTEPNKLNNIHWHAAIILVVLSVSIVAMSLKAAEYNSRVDWSEPYSLVKPFFPMRLYPLRFWLLGSVVTSSTGLVLSVHNIAVRGNLSPGSCFGVLLGTSILLVISPWLFKHRENNRSAEDTIPD
jgi:hypothetical protein